MQASHILRRILVIVTVMVATASGTMVAAPAATAAVCSVSWGSKDKTSDRNTDRQIVGIRAGRHSCYDRLVIDLNGAATTNTGYDVYYVPGHPAIRGHALLRIDVRAPAHDRNGNPTYRPSNPAGAVNVSGYSTFRQVFFRGTSGKTSFVGIGVRARLPMRVFVLPGPGNMQRLVIDVAHHW